MSLPSKTDWAYVAAMMDGEGSFSITKATNLSKAGIPYPAYDCKVMVSNTSEVLVKWLMEKFGGSYRVGVKHISAKARANGQVSLKPCYRWTVEGYRKQELFLLAILPYLIIKREQAIVALEWTRMVNQKNPAKRLELHKQMIALNKGESPTTNTPNATIDYEAIKKVWETPGWSIVDPLVKIESELHGNMQSAPAVMPMA